MSAITAKTSFDQLIVCLCPLLLTLTCHEIFCPIILLILIFLYSLTAQIKLENKLNLMMGVSLWVVIAPS